MKQFSHLRDSKIILGISEPPIQHLRYHRLHPTLHLLEAWCDVASDVRHSSTKRFDLGIQDLTWESLAETCDVIDQFFLWCTAAFFSLLTVCKITCGTFFSLLVVFKTTCGNNLKHSVICFNMVQWGYHFFTKYVHILHYRNGFSEAAEWRSAHEEA